MSESAQAYTPRRSEFPIAAFRKDLNSRHVNLESRGDSQIAPTLHYVGMTKDEAGRRSWTFYEAVMVAKKENPC
jgi:hypothetical protein